MGFDLSSAKPVADSGFDLSTAKPARLPARSFDTDEKGNTIGPSGSPAARAALQPTSGMSGSDLFLAGMGKAPYDLARGTGQFVGAVNRDDVAASRAQDAALMSTGAARIGNLAGNIAMAVPTAFIPGANTMAGAGLISAGMGAMQPSTSTGETLGNTALGGVLGPAGIAVGRGLGAAYQAAKGSLEPLFKGGQERIAARTLQAFAGTDKDAAAAAARLQNPPSMLPGLQPTTAEISGNAGLAQLERGLKNNPEYIQALTDRSQANRGVMTNALEGIAGTDADRAAAVGTRTGLTTPLYDAAGGVQVPADAELNDILARPSLKSAWGRAQQLAAERGDRLLIPGERPPVTGSTARMPMGAGVDPLTLAPNNSFSGMGSLGNLVDSPSAAGAGSNVARGAVGSVLDPLTLTKAQPKPDVYSGKAIQYLKMALNDMTNAGPQQGMGSHELGALKGTLGDLNAWTTKNVPELRAADAAYKNLSAPINQMDVGRELANKLTPALADFGNDTRLTAARYAQALRDGDATAARVTGNANSTLAGSLTPAQLGTTRQIAEQLARRANADELGRAAGSNTAQNLVSQNLMRQFLGPLGLPQSLSERAAQGALTPKLLALPQWVGSLGENNIQGLLREAALDPKVAAGLLSMKASSGKAAQGMWRRQGLLNAPTVAPALTYTQQQ